MEQSAWVRARLFLALCLDWLLSQSCGECWAGVMRVLYKEWCKKWDAHCSFPAGSPQAPAWSLGLGCYSWLFLPSSAPRISLILNLSSFAPCLSVPQSSSLAGRLLWHKLFREMCFRGMEQSRDEIMPQRGEGGKAVAAPCQRL